MKEFWNDRYSKPGYAYGKDPNGFFKEQLEGLNPGNLLLLGEGEGRNAVYAAKLGWNVTAVDFSDAAKEKALKFANEENVEINYILSDLEEYIPLNSYFDAVGIIFLHFHAELRERVHRQVINGLKKGGRILLECYEKENIRMNSGGPKDPDLLYSLEDVITDFADFEIINFEKRKVQISEGAFHDGDSFVVRFAGIKE